jgi:hypothetical protein
VKRKAIKNNGIQNTEDLKKTASNIFVNSLIFVLAGIIMVMGWSIYKKLTTIEVIEPDKSGEVASEIIQVEVLNGCGVTGVADRFTDFLRSQNYDVVKIDNYVSFDINETMVIDRIGNLANAKKVAASLGIKPARAFRQLNSDYFVDVTVIIGRDYHSLAPLN